MIVFLIFLTFLVAGDDHRIAFFNIFFYPLQMVFVLWFWRFDVPGLKLVAKLTDCLFIVLANQNLRPTNFSDNFLTDIITEIERA